MDEKEYDGVTEKKDGESTTFITDIGKAIAQENPRNVFLNGQLYVEDLCDSLIIAYFYPDAINVESYKRSILRDFLKSRECSFSTKIKLLKSLGELKSEEENRKFIKLVDRRIITSLYAIGEIRNAFQHNLFHDDALKQVQKGSKLSFREKNLKDIKTLDELIEDFKGEIIFLYNELYHLVRSQANHKI